MKELYRSALALLILGGGVAPAWALDWPSDPLMNLRICSAPGEQRNPRIVGDGLGGAYVLWEDWRPYPGVGGYLTRIDETGRIDPRWPVDGARVASFQSIDAVLAPADRSGVLVAWSATQLLAQVFELDGTRRWGSTGVQLTSGAYSTSFSSYSQSTSPIAAFGDSAWLVAWADSRDQQYQDLRLDIYATWVSRSGVVLGPSAGLPICRAQKYQRDAVVISDGSGGAFIAWMDFRMDTGVLGPNDMDVYAQHLSGSGQILWASDGIPVASGPRYQGYPRLLTDGHGGLYIGWQDSEKYLETARSFVVVQHLQSDGSVAPNWPAGGLRVDSQTDPREGAPFLHPDGQGGVIVVWGDYRLGGPMAQRIDAAGNLLWGADGVSFGRNLAAASVSDSAGGVIVVGYAGYPTLGGRDIFAQRLDATGQRLWGDTGIAVCLAPNNQERIVLASDGGMGAIAAWNDYREASAPGATDSIDVYAQNVQADGTLGGVVTAVAPGLIQATASAGRVMVEWYVADAAAVEIERCTASSSWSRAATAYPDAAGRVRYEDRSVVPGERYGYRMRVTTSRGEIVAGETWIEVPASLKLALQGFVPNPMAGEGRLSFTTASSEPVLLELYSVDGRRVRRLELAGLAPGRHVVSLEPLSAPGVYLIRLEQGGERREAKGMVVR